MYSTRREIASSLGAYETFFSPRSASSNSAAAIGSAQFASPRLLYPLIASGAPAQRARRSKYT